MVPVFFNANFFVRRICNFHGEIPGKMRLAKTLVNTRTHLLLKIVLFFNLSVFIVEL